MSESSPAVPDPYDRGGRYMVRENTDFLGWLLSLRPDEYDFVIWLDTRGIVWPGAPEQTRDTLAHVRDRAAHGVPWAILVEFQFAPDPDMLSRLMIYLAEARMRLRPTDLPGDRFQVGAVVVNLTGRGDSGRDMHWPRAGLRTLVQVREINLSQMSASWVMDAVDVGAAPLAALAFIPLMKGGAEDGTIKRWPTLAVREPSAHKRADLAYVVQTMAEAVECKQVWQDALGGWNVQESQLLNEWTEKMVQRKAVEMLVRVFQARFGTVPADLTEALRAIKDVNRLDALVPLAVSTESFEAFRKATGL